MNLESDGLPSVEELRRCFRYADGVLYHSKKRDDRNRSWHVRYAGKPAGYVRANGYISTWAGGRVVRAHRIIWKMHHGIIPSDRILDHINCNKSDNRLENLRLVTHRQNNFNSTGRTRRSKHGRGLPKGVCWHKRTGKYIARIKMHGISTHLGYYDCPIAAGNAYQAEAQAWHGKYYWEEGNK